MAPALRALPQSAADQAAPAGELVAAPPVVEVVDRDGVRQADVPLGFRAIAGGGTVAPDTARTQADGRTAPVAWRLGPTLGLQAIEAAGPLGVVARFTATGLPHAGMLGPDTRCPASPALAPAAGASSATAPAPWSLPATSARLVRRATLVVVAVGSSTTAGVGASVPDSAYVAVLARRLAALFPASLVTVYNAGVSGTTLAQLQPRFGTLVLPRGPHLVVLQTGTNDFRAGVPVDTFVAQLHASISELRAEGADVVLMDSQRYPGAGETVEYQRYVEAMDAVARERAVPLVPRYAWMGELLATGRYSYAQMLYTDQFHNSDLMHHCLATYLAEGVVVAASAFAGY